MSDTTDRATLTTTLCCTQAVHAEIQRRVRLAARVKHCWPRASRQQGSVQRLMKPARHQGKTKRRSSHDRQQPQLPVAPDLLQRDFSPARPDQVWTTDITYIWTHEGWLFLTVILDLFSRSGGWSMQHTCARSCV